MCKLNFNKCCYIQQMLKQLNKEIIPSVPESLERLYKDLTIPESKKGNDLPKPNRFSREIKIKENKRKDIEEQRKLKELKEVNIAKKQKEKKAFARLLEKKNKKGQPKLKNTLFYLCNKLGIKQ